MRVALVGASGAMGASLLGELLNRQHEVTAIARHPDVIEPRERVTRVACDANATESLVEALRGHGAIILAIRFLGIEAGRLVGGITRSGVKRVIVSGHSGTLQVSENRQLVDTDAISPFFQPEALDAREAYKVLRKADHLDWTYAAPAALLTPGRRTGQYRLGSDYVLRDRLGESRISTEDFAIALIDELEDPKHIRKRFTAAY